ncbi:DUF6415 family natural product biosynthesis protein [Streptomyces boncukensis]|uniref:Uncharacterized protein n=1 Tax=Streptomyces boncukensis TaxID=2711219 RepID=A0A6G4X8T3_9ACTN|nr:DUF6415 family natural product biosynthesis protein [Streptomyces boncukensis]NGO73071.1 hypothetical protein [Streptomyces boncukensis]
MTAPEDPHARARRDVAAALLLAEHQPGPDSAAQALHRLRTDVAELLPEAQKTAEQLPADTRRRDVALSSVAFARTLLHKSPPGRPAHLLRIWAKTTTVLLAYTETERPCRR